MAAWKDGTALFVCVLVVVLETVFRRFAAARAAAAPGIGHKILNIDHVIRGGGARVPQNVPTFPGAGQTITTITETKTITDGVPDTVAAFPGLYISIMV
jgi:hypothetical protein